MKNNIPVIDLFAGPGGLGEGFSCAGFDITLSIEMDPVACKTLRLRKFLKLFNNKNVPELYYEVVKEEKPLSAIEKRYPEKWASACKKVLQAEIGIDNEVIYKKILDSLKGYDTKNLIVIGGPPCQAYSLAGRSKRLGLGDKYNQKFKNLFNGEEINKLDAKLKLKKITDKINNTNTSVKDIILLKELEIYISEKIKDFYTDSRHLLYEQYLKIIEYFEPAVFVMENVKGINSATLPTKNKQKVKVLDKILNDIDDLDYKTFAIGSDKNKPPSLFDNRDFLIKCEDYGIPQKRHRVIIIGIKNNNINVENLQIEKEVVSVKDMIFDMPKIRSGLSKEIDTYENWLGTIEKQVNEKNINKLKETINIIKDNGALNRGLPFIKNTFRKNNHKVKTWIYDENLNGVIQHTSRSHMNSDLVRYLYSSWFSKKNECPTKLSDWPINLKPMHKNITELNGKLSSNSHIDRFKVQEWNKPSNTITSHISKDGHYFIHPDPTQCRSFTPREAARMQTFPENYFFFGGRTLQYHQIGNAVPPYLAYQIALKIINLLLPDSF